MTTRPQKKVSFFVSEVTYDRLREYARKHGEQIGTITTALIDRWLDDEEAGLVTLADVELGLRK